MEDNFTASNGIIVGRMQNPLRWVLNPLERTCHILPGELDALREFFRAEEDERLGRWRWPDEPRFVVYPWHNADDPNPRIAIVDEGTGGQFTTTRATASGTDTWAKVARAYFDAHPEPKPWHNAKPDEVWALKFGVSDEEEIVLARDELFVNIGAEPRWFDTAGKRAPEIAAGRRIWPEEAS